MSAGAPDPWSIDYFNPPTPHVAPPTPRTKTPRLIPESDRLFQVQRNSLLTLGALDALEAKMGKEAHKYHKELRALRAPAENTYRVIRSYLEKYLGNGQA